MLRRDPQRLQVQGDRLRLEAGLVAQPVDQRLHGVQVEQVGQRTQIRRITAGRPYRRGRAGADAIQAQTHRVGPQGSSPACRRRAGRHRHSRSTRRYRPSATAGRAGQSSVHDRSRRRSVTGRTIAGQPSISLPRRFHSDRRFLTLVARRPGRSARWSGKPGIPERCHHRRRRGGRHGSWRSGRRRRAPCGPRAREYGRSARPIRWSAGSHGTSDADRRAAGGTPPADRIRGSAAACGTGRSGSGAGP